jgi:hypothetical protein
MVVILVAPSLVWTVDLMSLSDLSVVTPRFAMEPWKINPLRASKPALRVTTAPSASRTPMDSGSRLASEMVALLALLLAVNKTSKTILVGGSQVLPSSPGTPATSLYVVPKNQPG